MPARRKPLPPAEVLRKHFRIDSLGRLERYTKTHGWQRARMTCGEYRTVCFKGVNYLAHRLIWAVHYGEQPPDSIDHISGDKWDNRIENLRAATLMQNNWNKKHRRSNRYGRRVIKTPAGYRARVIVDYTCHLSPPFADADLAELVGDCIAARYQGEWAYRGIPNNIQRIAA